MPSIRTFQIRDAFRDYADISTWDAPYAVTLTLRQKRIAHDDRGRQFEVRLTPDRASQNFRHFLKLLNAQMFGKAATRFGRCVNVIPILEGGDGKRLHYHAVINCPCDDLRDQFHAAIFSCWSKTDWGYWEHDVQPGADAGWIDYISKTRDKPVFADAIDWTNCHMPIDRRV